MATVFGDLATRRAISDSLTEKMYGDALATVPTKAQVRTAVVPLIETLTAGCDQPGTDENDEACGLERTRTVLKAACSALLSSAPVLLH